MKQTLFALSRPIPATSLVCGDLFEPSGFLEFPHDTRAWSRTVVRLLGRLAVTSLQVHLDRTLVVKIEEWRQMLLLLCLISNNIVFFFSCIKNFVDGIAIARRKNKSGDECQKVNGVFHDN